MKSLNNFIALDFETGGLDFKKNPIVQAAYLTIDSVKLKETNRFETYVKPYNNLVIEEKALKINMLKLSDINKGMELKTFVKFTKEYFKQATNGTQKPILVGHNVWFDIEMIIEAFRLAGENFMLIWDGGYVDTMTESKRAWNHIIKNEDENSYSLKACCKRLKIKLVDAHGAMPDTIAASKVFVHFTNIIRFGNVEGNEEGAKEVREKKARDTFEI